jgi:uncharacterized protein (TIGR02246 family)
MRFADLVSAPVFATACLVMFTCAGHVPPPADSTEADSAAIKQVCADFSESFSHHDPHGVAMTFAEDADFANMTGRHAHGRANIENWFAGLFRGNLKDSARTDTVRSIRFYTPELAEAEAETVITGTKSADGSELPARKGLMIVLMTKQGGHWLIGSFHEAEYPTPRAAAATSAAAPAPSN